MGMKPQTIALIAAGTAVTVGVGYLVYFDYKRRNDPQFRRKLKREQKKLAKEAKKAEEKAKLDIAELIKSVLDAASKEAYPKTPEEKEKYFMEQVAVGEALCAKGEEYYGQALLPFYKALKIYPAPLELIMIYQKTLPQTVFNLLINIMSFEQTKRQNEFYDQFPPKETHVKIGELPAGKTEDGTPIVRRGLVADEDIEEGQVIYVEPSFVAALHPELEGAFCNFCLKKVGEEKVSCTNCDKVVFCSDKCKELADRDYHQFLCTNNTIDAENKTKEKDFFQSALERNEKYPYMVARFLCAMVAEEKEKNKREQEQNPSEPNKTHFGAWDHIDRLRYLDIKPNPEVLQETKTIAQLLGSKVPGVEEFLTDEIYLTLKGRFMYNCYAVVPSESVETTESSERIRKTPAGEKSSVGAALYKISTYVGQAKSEEEANTVLEFKEGDHHITATAIKKIEKGQELLAVYDLPKPE